MKYKTNALSYFYCDEIFFCFDLYALTTEYIQWAKVPFPISLVFSSFIYIKKFAMNAKSEIYYLIITHYAI